MDDDSSGGNERKKDEDSEWPRPRGEIDSARLGTAFHVLSDRRRRYLLYRLVSTADGVAERSELVDAVRAFEMADGDTADVPTEEACGADLHHRQLPRLDEAGVIDYDARQGTVRYRGTPTLEEWLEHAHYSEVGRTL